MKVKSLSRVRLFVIPWTVAYQVPPSMGFSWQEYWSGLPFPSPEDLPNPGIEPGSLAFQVDTLTSEPAWPCPIVANIFLILIPISMLIPVFTLILISSLILILLQTSNRALHWL